MSTQVVVQTPGVLHVTVHTASPVQVQMQDVNLVNIVGEKYEGAYEVTPATYLDTVLATQDKVMNKDVTVFKIPQFEVSNDSEGKTLIIGEEYYG